MLVFQILLAVVLLAGLISTIMSVKHWHWAQMLLLLAIFLSSFGTLVLGLEVFRIHKSIRSKIPPLELKIAELQRKNDAMEHGAEASMAATVFAEPPFDAEAEGRMPPLEVWTRRLQDVYRQRGRVWRGVRPTGPIDPATRRIAVTIPEPTPHGLEQDALVYVFEQGEPNAATPQQGAQYLGEFRVAAVAADAATLEAVQSLDRRTSNRILASQAPWAIYETMPADRHALFAGAPEEVLRQWFPGATADQYVRHGSKVERPAEADAFDPTIAAFDEQGNRLGPDERDKAVEWKYERPLRDYAYLFAATSRQLVELRAQRDSLREDVRKLGEALEISKKFVAMRTEEQAGLAADLAHMQKDQEAIAAHLAMIQRLLQNVERTITETQAENERMAQELRQRQVQALENADQAAPGPRAEFTGVR